jgi:RimJ/RimL family protein N-acetyltransferase
MPEKSFTWKMEHNPDRISFRKLSDSDLPLFHHWLNSPEVAKWYREGGSGYPSLDYVREKWGERLTGSDRTQCFIIQCDNQSIGYIQCALNDDNPEYKAIFKMEESTAGIDLLIGEDKFRHKGWGSFIITRFLKEILFDIYKVDICTIDPEPENKIAIRAYEKAGFRYLKTVWNPIDNVWAHIMLIRRDLHNNV